MNRQCGISLKRLNGHEDDPEELKKILKTVIGSPDGAEKDGLLNVEVAGKLSDYYWNLVMPEHTDDKEWTDQLFRWTKTAANLEEDEYEYTYRLGWLYAEGIGCKKSFWVGLKYFGRAFLEGDWRGAQSIADLLDERLNSDASLSDEEKSELKEDIQVWRIRAEEMRNFEIGNDNSENDLEED